MFDSQMFVNSEALQKLASLNPLAESALAAGAHSRSDGKRTTASGGKDVVGAERLGGEFQKVADAPWLKVRLILRLVRCY